MALQLALLRHAALLPLRSLHPLRQHIISYLLLRCQRRHGTYREALALALAVPSLRHHFPNLE